MSSSETSANQLRLKIRNRLNDYTDDSWPYSSRTTHLEGWRIVVQEPPGRLKWKYLKTDSERERYHQDTTMKFFLELPTVCFLPSTLNIYTDETVYTKFRACENTFPGNPQWPPVP